VAAPTIIDKSPAPDSTGNSNVPTITFSINDDVDVDQSTIQIFVDGVLVYKLSTGFSAQYSAGSSITTNAFNGFDLSLVRATRFTIGSTVVIRALAQDFASTLVDETWSFVTSDFPKVINRVPVPDSLVLKGVDVEFSIIDGFVGGAGGLWGTALWGQQMWGQGLGVLGIILSTVNVVVEAIKIFDGTTFIDGWKDSTFAANAQSGFDFVLKHDLPFASSSNEIRVTVTATNQVGDTVKSTWTFDINRPFRFSVYRMLIRSMRQQDEA